MGDRGGRTRLLLKAQHAQVVVGYGGGKKFERDLSVETGIVGQVDFAHATVAEHIDDLVAADSLANQPRPLGTQDLQRQRHRRVLHEAVLTIRGSKQREDLVFETHVSLRLLLYKDFAVGGVEFKGGVVKGLNPIPSI